MTELYKNKNLLALYPADDSGFPMRFDPFKPYFGSVRTLNYADACHSGGIKNTERHILDLIDRKKIDIVICCPFASDYQLSVAFYASVREKAKLVFWFSDDASYFESYSRYYAQTADAVITTDYFLALSYKNRLEIPAFVCQELTASNKFCPVDVKKDIDVCFIGDMRKRGRREYIDFLRKSGITVEVYGQGSEKGYLPPEKISEYICRSRINLNFSQITTPDWKSADEQLLNKARQNTGRPREIAITGAFCLSEYSPSMDGMFKPGEQVDFFRDKEELLEKIRYYLANPEKREMMARAAHEYAVQNYLADTYVPRLLEELEPYLVSPRRREPLVAEIYLSRGFKTREINSLTFSMFVMLRRRNLPAALETFFLLFKHGPVVFLQGFSGGLRRAIANIRGKLAGASR